MRRFVATWLACVLTSGGLSASDTISAEDLAFFEQHIRPVLVNHCYSCHSEGASGIKGGLTLDTRAGWARGGESGEPAIVPGRPDDSPLLRFIRHAEPGMEMPPDQPRLPDDVIAAFATWIERGAPDPRIGDAAEVRRADLSWWSLQPLSQAEPPETPGLPAHWSSSPIDQFVFAKLHEAGLTPNAPADRRKLIRRATYDLTGLPPSAEEVEAFVADEAPDAYERLIDRLLESPHYGERWGRHWLDVVRFGESRGFERNEIIPDAWPFRDYVIRSFNEDKPFDRLVLEHLAGDIVAKDQPADEIGVAFLTIGPYDDVGNQDPVAAANIRAATLDDIVTATGSAFLGLTLNCARCHHHKFDPIPTEDYYRVKSAFEGVSHGSRPLATAAEREAREATLKPLLEERERLQQARRDVEAGILARADAAGEPPPARPAPSAHLTEETFTPTAVRQVRLTVLAHSDNPHDGVHGRIDEFEVWTPGPDARNVALASSGAVARGATGRTAEDFRAAYGVDLVNDGKYSARWFIGSPPVLTIILPAEAVIDRVTFSHDRNAETELPIPGQGPSVAEYEIDVSLDGETWTRVADSHDRMPLTEGLARQRKFRKHTRQEDTARYAELDRTLADVNRRIGALPSLPTAWVGNIAPTTATTPVFRGGDPQQAVATVAPASLQVLERVAGAYALAADAPESERRLALARWITAPENPLTPRVLANRVWHYHFGTGIVDTPGDFGYLGGQPTHPELLDWLASRLHAHGWRLKPLHRELLLSQTYRQSGAYREEAGAVDGGSRLLWRFPPRRLSAEEVRDTLLSAAGVLDLRMGGPGYQLYEYQQDNVSTYIPLDSQGPDTYRRAVYHQNTRATVVDVLSDFDLPDNAFASPKRSATTTPLQALTMLNHSFLLDMAEALADRVERAAPNDLPGQIEAAFRFVHQRSPSAEERGLLTEAVEAAGWRSVCRALLNSNELLFVE
ncbi:MAG: DUF1553 domain-containing protein [Planctomyces sp.]|nr:DUF1553 domain-containing protein [Planctomyces sp.]